MGKIDIPSHFSSKMRRPIHAANPSCPIEEEYLPDDTCHIYVKKPTLTHLYGNTIFEKMPIELSY